MSIAFHITYLVLIFTLAVYAGASASKLYNDNWEHELQSFIFVKNKKGVEFPKIIFPAAIAQSCYMCFFWIYGGLMLITQQWIVEILRSYLDIEIKPLFDASENSACWIYGGVTWAGYFAGKALLYQFAAIQILKNIKEIPPHNHTFQQVFKSLNERSQFQ